jgi:hypothetical protein
MLAVSHKKSDGSFPNEEAKDKKCKCNIEMFLSHISLETFLYNISLLIFDHLFLSVEYLRNLEVGL